MNQSQKIIKKTKYRQLHKKGDLPFWLVIMIVSLVFGFIVLVISSGAIKDFLKSTTSIKVKTTANSVCFVPPNAPDSIDKNHNGLDDTKTYTDENGKEIKCDDAS